MRQWSRVTQQHRSVVQVHVGERGREAVAERFDVRSGLGKTRRLTGETDGAEREGRAAATRIRPCAVPGACALPAARYLCQLAMGRRRTGAEHSTHFDLIDHINLFGWCRSLSRQTFSKLWLPQKV